MNYQKKTLELIKIGDASHVVEHIRGKTIFDANVLADIFKLAKERAGALLSTEPVARLHVTQDDTFLEGKIEILNGENLQPEHSPVDLYLAPTAHVPAGYKLVPIEPDQAMLNAGFYSHGSKDCYERMVKVAKGPEDAGMDRAGMLRAREALEEWFCEKIGLDMSSKESDAAINKILWAYLGPPA
ncbi:hypothetical protein [Herbaspirillum huttiense]|uniref:Uncharacterized protein n=1 Tax=Herbaspirillum huttiense subsp. lycopersici TaxID=3074428 RepID=A0ABU2EG11_9BURK|nr:hypothetical protein [Herbaspirillum huttiense]MDR9847079.1 hypothetical protein [Herbaspirillum huttiense SE1]